MERNWQILVDFDHTLFDTEKFKVARLESPEKINYKDFLYPDALDFIKYASKFGKAILFSEGEPDFQKEKIDGTEIEKLFSGGVKIYPSYSKIGELLKIAQENEIILIDDKPDVIDEAISAGCKVIRVRRGKYANEETKLKPEFVVEGLSEIVSKNLLQRI